MQTSPGLLQRRIPADRRRRRSRQSGSPRSCKSGRSRNSIRHEWPRSQPMSPAKKARPQRFAGKGRRFPYPFHQRSRDTYHVRHRRRRRRDDIIFGEEGPTIAPLEPEGPPTHVLRAWRHSLPPPMGEEGPTTYIFERKVRPRRWPPPRATDRIDKRSGRAHDGAAGCLKAPSSLLQQQRNRSLVSET